MLTPKIIDTIGALIDDGHRVNCWCSRRLAGKPDADLPALAAQLGRDFVYVHPRGCRLDRHLWCPDCGAPMETRISPTGAGMGRRRPRAQLSP